MPCTPGAVNWFEEQGVLYCPGKAVNAGGVAVSGSCPALLPALRPAGTLLPLCEQCWGLVSRPPRPNAGCPAMPAVPARQVSGLEMTQDFQGLQWSEEEVRL